LQILDLLLPRITTLSSVQSVLTYPVRDRMEGEIGMPKGLAATESYMELVRRFPLRPVRSEADLDRASTMIHSLLDRKLNAGEREYLDVLSDLTRLYEQEHHAIVDLPPREILAHLITERGISQRALAAAVDIPVSTISEILSGKRTFALGHVRALASYFKVSPEVFLTSD
jgi:HTH-type transcriptional regulator/antitoxin HigA